MRRLLLLVVGLLAAWLGVKPRAVGVVELPNHPELVHAYTYGALRASASCNFMIERGPPAQADTNRTARGPADDCSYGASSCLFESTACVVYRYDQPNHMARTARAAGMVGTPVDDHLDIHHERVAAKTASGAESAVAGRNLGPQLASEQEMGGTGVPLVGAGSNTKLRVAGRLADDYGGVPEDWAKMCSSSYRGADGFQFETHWYENVLTGGCFEFKVKAQWLP